LFNCQPAQPQETLLRMIEQIFRPAAVFADFFLINQTDERVFVAVGSALLFDSAV